MYHISAGYLKRLNKELQQEKLLVNIKLIKSQKELLKQLAGGKAFCSPAKTTA